MSTMSRRELLKLLGAGAASVLAAGCQPKVVEVEKVVKETVVVTEKETVVVKEAVEVEKEVTRVVEKAIEAPKEKVTLTWMAWGGVDRLQATVDGFMERNPDLDEWIDVEVISPGNHDAEVYQALRLALAAGGEGLPDIAQLNYIGLPEFAAAGQLTRLGGFMEEVENDMLPGTKTLASYEGVYVAVPTQIKTKVWYYRKDMFEDAGIDITAIKTYDDYMEAGHTFHEKFPESYIMNIGPQPIHYWYFMILSHWEDTCICSEDGEFQLTKNPHFRELLTWLNDWHTSGIAFNTDDWSSDWQPGFENDVICGDLVSQWMDHFLPKYAPGQKDLWGKAPWPEFNRWGSEAGGGVAVIPNGAKNPQAAFTYLIRENLQTDGAVNKWRLSGSLPLIESGRQEIVKQAADFERPEGMSDEDWAVQPINFFGKDYMNAHYESMNYLRVPCYDPMASAELDLLRKHTETFMAGDETLDEALENAQMDMEMQIGNPYE